MHEVEDEPLFAERAAGGLSGVLGGPFVTRGYRMSAPAGECRYRR
jgi:hypothetical protein